MLNEYPDILKPQDLIKILGISKNSVYTMLNNNVIPAYRIGGGKIWLINKSDLIEYLDSNRDCWN
jgi:excisionase family DNA binding protein